MEKKELQRIYSRRAILAGIGGAVVWSGMIFRLAQLQLYEGEEFRLLADENRIKLNLMPPRRGTIYDRFGIPLATHRRVFRIVIIPEEVNDMASTLGQLSNWVTLSSPRIGETHAQAQFRAIDKILRRASSRPGFIPIIIASDVTFEEFSRISVRLPDVKGVYAEEGLLRSYAEFPEAFVHVIGYVKRANGGEIQKLSDEAIEEASPRTSEEERYLKSSTRELFLHPDMRLGKYGAEGYADRFLRGTSGYERIAINANGRIIERLDSEDLAPVEGHNVVLTLDAELHQYAYNRLGDHSGSIVVMDTVTGELLAFVSKPGFDPNAFVSGISTKDYKALTEDKRSPLYNKAFDGVYPPGSTFKPVVALAALQEGVIEPSERIVCRGEVQLGNRKFRCWKKRGHGAVNMHEAMKGSCDVYFYEIAKRLGVDAISEAARAFGFGERIDIGLTGGARGLVPTRDWKQKRFKEPWVQGETYNYGIGQGFLTATPLQLAVMTGRIATGNSALSPKIFRIGPEVTAMSAGAEKYYFEPILARIRASLVGVTTEPGGTALSAGDLGVDGVRLAGKTGTAQVRRISEAEHESGVIDNADLPREQRDHALFISYAPIESPRYVCSVIVEHGGGGSAVAAPIARDVLAEAVKRKSATRPFYKDKKPGQMQAKLSSTGSSVKAT